jgi:hypothetical protein
MAFPFVLHRAPDSFVVKAHRGAAWKPRIFRGPGKARRKIPPKDEARRVSRRDATQGSLFFRLFLLAEQKK